ncbi:hypothetical protein [Pseudorhodoferax sp.]|uniref:hypothetical protein n=1 Tax=Pseudorhodoferax sp. TaxID=1993553 RepID=UPI002DD674F5|nr:hypothetical protein [Pseudorhodoferax sp.]
MLDTLSPPLRRPAGSPRLASVPTPHPVPPVPPPVGPFDDDEPLNPEPGTPVQEPPDEGDVPARLPGHPGKPVHVRRRHTARHEHPGA